MTKLKETCYTYPYNYGYFTFKICYFLRKKKLCSNKKKTDNLSIIIKKKSKTL